MKGRICSIYFIALLISLSSIAQSSSSGLRLFDEGWRFFRGNVAGAEQQAFNDKAWRQIDLPHDWSIEDLSDTASPFISTAISGVSGGFTTGGIGWYRKTFSLLPSQKGKRTILQFDGVYMNADVWVNGQHLGNHPYGYTSFWYDITDALKWGSNTIAVQVKNEGRNSRWYSGSGIYRHVWLRTVDDVHIAQWGTYITTPEVSATSAKISVQTTINNSGGPSAVTIVTKITNNKGNSVATESRKVDLADTGNSIQQYFTIKNPQLWSINTPVLYTAAIEVWRRGRMIDQAKTVFGIRSIQFDAVNGFRLNGQQLELKGGCIHHDNGPLGAKAYDRAEERKVELLKASGYNAIRTSHNPPSPAFLEACDRLGLLVIDEAFDMWADRKNKDDYHIYFKDWWQKDLESMLLRDRNHPSVIMWSTGNEIPNRDKPEVVAVSKMLSDYIHAVDPTRPVTCGVNGIEENKDPILATLDVSGYNYARDKYVSEHQRVPDRVVFASESFAIEAYEYWKDVEQYPWVIGDFVWTAFDYIGEASIGWLGYPQNKNFFPWNLAYCGDIDVCGWKRPQSYYRDVLWKKDQLSLFIKAPVPSFDRTNPRPEVWSRWNWPDVVQDWNWPGFENKPVEVVAYSDLEEVELFLNNRSLGRKKNDTAFHYILSWQVPYNAGTLKAIGYKNGKQVKAVVLSSPQKASQLKLTADRKAMAANGQDLVYVTVELTDKNSIIDPKAENLIKFDLEGPGEIVAIGNADPESTESYQQHQRKAWRGRCLVIIKSEKKRGTIKLKASADGLSLSSLTLTSN